MMHKYIGWPRVLRLLKAEGHSQRRIADQVGVDQATICRLSSGVSKSISFESAERLLTLAGGRVIWPERDLDESPSHSSGAESHAL